MAKYTFEHYGSQVVVSFTPHRENNILSYSTVVGLGGQEYPFMMAYNPVTGEMCIQDSKGLPAQVLELEQQLSDIIHAMND